MDVEDEVSVVLLRFALLGLSGVRGGRAVVFQAPEAVFQTARVSERQRFRNLNNEAVRSEFQSVRVRFCIFEILGSWYAAEDLDARAGGVAEQAQQGEADTDCDADAEVPEEGCEEDEGH